jgi:hypothetical protein
MLVDPTNPIMASMMSEKARATDDRIITALLREQPQRPERRDLDRLPGGQIIAVDNRDFIHDAESLPASGNLPLTVGKLIKAKVMLDQSELEGERYFACSAIQLGNLLSSTPVTSSDYNTIKALVNGQDQRLHGLQLHPHRAAVRGVQHPQVRGLGEAGDPVQGTPDRHRQAHQRADRSYRWQAYYEVERGALRRYDKAWCRCCAARSSSKRSLNRAGSSDPAQPPFGR